MALYTPNRKNNILVNLGPNLELTGFLVDKFSFSNANAMHKLYIYVLRLLVSKIWRNKVADLLGVSISLTLLSVQYYAEQRVFLLFLVFYGSCLYVNHLTLT